MRNNCYYLQARRGDMSARYAVVPCANGWYEHFVDGDRRMRHFNRYVSHENLNDLIKWWQSDFDSYNYTSVPDIDQLREDLRRVWTFSHVFVDNWSEASSEASSPSSGS